MNTVMNAKTSIAAPIKLIIAMSRQEACFFPGFVEHA